jgi:hypothetical protein
VIGFLRFSPRRRASSGPRPQGHGGGTGGGNRGHDKARRRSGEAGRHHAGKAVKHRRRPVEKSFLKMFHDPASRQPSKEQFLLEMAIKARFHHGTAPRRRNGVNFSA